MAIEHDKAEEYVLIKNNDLPVEAEFVLNPIDWKYSSARNYGDDLYLFYRLILEIRYE